MTSVGINTASLQTQTASFVSVSMSQVTVSSGKDFSSLLNGNLTAQSQQGGTKTYTDLKLTKTDISKEATPVSSKDTVSASNDASADKAGQTQEVKPDTTQRTDEAAGQVQNTKEAANTQAAANSGEIGDASQDIDDCVKALEVLNTLLQGIAQMLDTTTKNLMGQYEELGIEPSQIITVTNIQITVVTFEGLSDPSDLLVNNDAFDLFNRINEFVQQVLEDAGFTTEEFENILQTDMFAEFVGPVETGSVEEIISKFAFDENGKLIINEKTEENVKPVIENDQEEPFTVEVNIDKTAGTEESSKAGSEAGTESGNGTESGKASGTNRTVARDTRTPATAAESFVRGLENAINVNDIDMPVAEGVTVRDIVYQVVDAIRVNITNESTSLEMNLNPENLGRVSLNIQSRDGVMTAQITTENDAARAALESQLQILKDNFEAQGVRVEAIEVTVSSFSFSDSRNAQSEAREHPEDNGRVARTGRRTGTAESVTTDEAIQEKLEQEVMEQNGSTVSYTA